MNTDEKALTPEQQLRLIESTWRRLEPLMQPWNPWRTLLDMVRAEEIDQSRHTKQPMRPPFRLMVRVRLHIIFRIFSGFIGEPPDPADYFILRGSVYGCWAALTAYRGVLRNNFSPAEREDFLRTVKRSDLETL